MKPEGVVAQVFGVDEETVDDTTSNKTLENWDSMNHVTLILQLEATFGISISMEEALEMTDVAAIKRVLANRGVAA